jgi:hypothetical protein
LFHAPGATLGTSSAGCAAPDVFTFNFSQTECGLPDDLANAELSDPVPWTNSIAQSALKAKPEGFSTSLFDLLYHFFEGSDCFHCLYQSSSLALMI